MTKERLSARREDSRKAAGEEDREDDRADAEKGHPSLGPHDYRNDDESDTDTADTLPVQLPT